MFKNPEIDKLKSLPLEVRAKQSEISLSCTASTIVFLCGLIPGLFYCFGGEFLFKYSTIGPIGGLLLFILMGIILLILVNYLYSSYWESYNQEIRDANMSIEKIIKENGENPTGEITRLKKELIERKIENTILSDEEFAWHTKRYCWGCGKEHLLPTKQYRVKRERVETWKEGVYNYRKTFYESANIEICPECYMRLTTNDKIKKQNEDVREPIRLVLCVITAIVACTIAIISIYDDRKGNMWESILSGLLALILSFSAAMTFGQIIIYPLAHLISLPFTQHKGLDKKTRWDFDNIPQIKKFLTKKLPHTHD